MPDCITVRPAVAYRRAGAVAQGAYPRIHSLGYPSARLAVPTDRLAVRTNRLAVRTDRLAVRMNRRYVIAVCNHAFLPRKCLHMF